MPLPLLLPAIMAGGQALGSIIGGNKQAKAAKKQAEAQAEVGRSEQSSAYFEAKQMETAAGQQQAVAQQAMAEELRRSELMQSRALAIAGASGAGLSDPNIVKIMGDLAAEGRLAAETQKFNGDEAARAMRVGAKIRRWEGNQARKGAAASAEATRSSIQSIKFQTILDVAGTASSWYSGLPKDKNGSVTSWFGGKK